MKFANFEFNSLLIEERDITLHADAIVFEMIHLASHRYRDSINFWEILNYLKSKNFLMTLSILHCLLKVKQVNNSMKILNFEILDWLPCKTSDDSMERSENLKLSFLIFRNKYIIISYDWMQKDHTFPIKTHKQLKLEMNGNHNL